MLNRRQFLTLSGGAAAGGVAAWAGLVRDRTSAKPSSAPEAAAASASSDHVLVVVQLSGGNDALNTLAPHDGRYHDLRPTLAVADNELVTLNGAPAVGLHPALQPLVPLWDAGRLALLPQLGFAADSRSHFESLASGWTASPEHRHTTGWIGRWLDASGAGKDNPLAAIALGGGGAPILRADHTQSTSINDLARFRLAAPKALDGARLADVFAATAAPASTDPIEAQAQASVASATRAVSLLANAKSPANATGGEITDGLATVADLLQMNLGTRVFVVTASGFDTHANQAPEHQRLLGDVAKGIATFSSALDASGHADKVVLVTTSEFGRRAQENGSGGSDHGHGGVHLAVGPRVLGGVHGDVDLGHLVDGDLAATVDARSLYAAALEWLGGPSAELLDGHTDTYGLIRS